MAYRTKRRGRAMKRPRFRRNVRRRRRSFHNKRRGGIRKRVQSLHMNRLPYQIYRFSQVSAGTGTAQLRTVLISSNVGASSSASGIADNYAYSVPFSAVNNTILRNTTTNQGWTGYNVDNLLGTDGRDVIRIQKIQFDFQYSYSKDIPSCKLEYYLFLRPIVGNGVSQTASDYLKEILGEDAWGATEPYRRYPEKGFYRLLAKWSDSFRGSKVDGMTMESSSNATNQSVNKTGDYVRNAYRNIYNKKKSIWFGLNGLKFRVFNRGSIQWLPSYFQEGSVDPVYFLGSNYNVPYSLELVTRNKLIDQNDTLATSQSITVRQRFFTWFRHESDFHAALETSTAFTRKLESNIPQLAEMLASHQLASETLASQEVVAEIAV